jgi:hypothetical protein
MAHSNLEDERVYQKAYHAKNRDKIRGYGKAWYEKNRDERLAYLKAWRANNRDKHRAADRRWRQQHSEKRCATSCRQNKRANKATRAKAYAHRSRWDNSEDLLILRDTDMAARELAFKLGRTLNAVRNRRLRLNHQVL